jgi:hypothetical protein
LVFFSFLVVACVCWLCRLNYQLLGFKPLCRVVRGPLCSELMQRTYLDASVFDAFPQPRETRVIVIRLWGCALSLRRASVGLPLECDARIGAIEPNEFDLHFRGDFRFSAWQKASLRWPVASAH